MISWHVTPDLIKRGMRDRTEHLKNLKEKLFEYEVNLRVLRSKARRANSRCEASIEKQFVAIEGDHETERERPM